MERINNLHKRIFESLKRTYEKKDKRYQEIRDLLAPGTGVFNSSDNLENETINYTKLLDSEPCSYLDTTTAGLYGGLINPASRWFDLCIDKSNSKYQDMDMYEIHSSLETAREFLYFLFAKSNFYSAMRPILSEWIRYGLGVMLIEERDWDFIFFNPLTIGEYYLGINEHGEYDKLARELTFTSEQMVKKFGKDKCPERVLEAYEKGDYEALFSVKHLICPNSKDGTVPNVFKFMDLYWIEGNERCSFLRKGGFKSNPIVVFSWERKNLRTIYPLGIGEKILGDVKELQFTAKSLNINKAYLANPALALHTSLGKKPILPGSRFYTDQDPAKVAAEIYRVNSHIPELEDSRARLLEKIRKISLADILMLFAQQQSPNRTATEVSAIVREQMTLLAPIYLQAKEGLNQVFRRVVEICKRRGAFKNLQGFDLNDIDIEFISSIAKAQKMAEVGSIQELIQYIAMLGQIKPGALDYINEDAIIKDIAERLGNASKINSDEQVAALRQSQAEAQAQAQQLETQAKQMKIAKDASKARLDPASILGQQVVSMGGELPPEAYPQNNGGF